MKKSKNIYPKLEKLAHKVHADFRKQGVSIPFYADDGALSVYGYRVIHETNGKYSITDVTSHVVVADINLAQTAMLLANSLSLGRWLDTDLINIDRQYGYQLFEKCLFKQSQATSMSRKNYDRAEWLGDKYNIANRKATTLKQRIDVEFGKLNASVSHCATDSLDSQKR